jgi:hypothetical protein
MQKSLVGTFDLSKKMGTLLRDDRNRYNFSNLDSIRDAYSAAFRDFANVQQPLADKSLNALSAARNLIVHKAGKADHEYVEKTKDAPTAPRLANGETLLLDGTISSGLIAPVVEVSTRLIRAVDSRVVAWRAT